MRSIFSEYGLAVMYVIAVISVLTIIFFAINNPDTGVIMTYNTNMVYANEFYAGTNKSESLNTEDTSNKLDGLDAVNNTVNTIKKPTFILLSTPSKDDYVLQVPDSIVNDSKVYYPYNEWSNLFSVNNRLSLVSWDNSDKQYKEQGIPNDVEIVITKLIPAVKGVDGSLKTELVESKDKYGNVIKNENGEIVMVEQVVYNEEVYSRDNSSEFFIDYDVACRYRVLFRYTDGVIKSEYSAMFANKIRPAEKIYEEVYSEWVNE